VRMMQSKESGGRPPRQLKVRDQRRVRIRGVDVDHGALADPIVPEPRRVGVVLNLEHSPVDHTAACAQEALDVPPVYRCAAIEPVLVAERLAR
jgi:hypothetical protein